MKYETPKLTALTPAIKAIQDLPKHIDNGFDSGVYDDFVPLGVYADWES
jgi:hypothetical protein